MKILLLEDDLVDQMAFSRWVKKEFPNFHLEVVSSIAQTKTILQNNQFDLLVCDYLLPDGNAADVAHFTDPKNIVCISGIDDPRRLKLLSAIGIEHFFFKDSQLLYLNQFKQFVAQRQQLDASQIPDAISTAQDNNQLIDLQHLKKTFDYKTQPVREVIEIFLEQTPPQLAELAIAVKDKSMKTCYSIAHRLKSSFRIMGLYRQIESLKKIEQDCCKGHFDNHQDYIDLVKELHHDSVKIFALLHQELKSL